MSIEEKNKEILDKIRMKEIHKDNGFIYDGIIDYNYWNDSKSKVMFFLKEAYYDKYTDWSLTNEISQVWKGPKYKMWWTISYWLYAIQETNEDSIPHFPESDEELELCRKYLLGSSIVNIKKSNGNSSSSYDDLKIYLEKDSSELKEQIENINPKIIVCGYTYEFFEKLFPSTKKIDNRIDFLFKVNSTLVLDYWHPANQYPDKLCYYTICALIREAKKSKLL